MIPWTAGFVLIGLVLGYLLSVLFRLRRLWQRKDRSDGARSLSIDRVRLYVCYGTFGPAERHACARARKSLVDAGYKPEVTRTYGCYGTDRLFSGRREVRRLTGNLKVPTLVLDDGTVIDGSYKIASWAASHPR